ncbi:MAG: hypothetical protein FWC03_10305 [Treponema sp.]|nr:hypothetical protein [Treponema sp.]
MKIKCFPVFLMIIVSLCASCDKSKPPDAATVTSASYTEEYEGGPTEDYEAFPPGFETFMLYHTILSGDLSNFAGTYANGRGDRRQLTSDGVFSSENPEGGFGDGIMAEGFEHISQESGDSYYQWVNTTQPDADGWYSGYIVVLFPPGVQIIEGGRIVQTDTSKIRMYVYAHDLFYRSDDVFYQEEENHRASRVAEADVPINDVNLSNVLHSQKSITIAGIPESLNGLYCNISLTIIGDTGIYVYLAWSYPEMVQNGSVTNVLYAYNNSTQTMEPFTRDGIFYVLVSINDLNSKNLPHWQGYNTFIIAGETSIIYWNDFSEVFG